MTPCQISLLKRIPFLIKACPKSRPTLVLYFPRGTSLIIALISANALLPFALLSKILKQILPLSWTLSPKYYNFHLDAQGPDKVGEIGPCPILLADKGVLTCIKNVLLSPLSVPLSGVTETSHFTGEFFHTFKLHIKHIWCIMYDIEPSCDMFCVYSKSWIFYQLTLL